jgi:hypothetical protein
VSTVCNPEAERGLVRGPARSSFCRDKQRATEVGGPYLFDDRAGEGGEEGEQIRRASYGLRCLKHCPGRRMGGTETRALGVEIVATRLSRTPSLLMVSACPRCSVCVCEREWVWEGSIYA